MQIDIDVIDSLDASECDRDAAHVDQRNAGTF
jgi:hypothetical protein